MRKGLTKPDVTEILVQELEKMDSKQNLSLKDFKELVKAFGRDPDSVLFPMKSFPAPVIISQAWEAGMGFGAGGWREWLVRWAWTVPMVTSARCFIMGTPLCAVNPRSLEGVCMSKSSIAHNLISSKAREIVELF